MVWTIIERLVHLTTLVILIIMLAIIFQNSKSNSDDSSLSAKLDDFREEVVRVRAHNIEYIEKKINKVAENGDNYQVTMTTKVNVLEQRLSKLEAEDKKSQRVVNVNTNTLTQTAYPQAKE